MTSSAFLLAITWLLNFGTVISSPVISEDIPDGYARDARYLKISPKPCQGPDGDWGVCMFNYECSRKKGTVLATCVDGFLFGACCQVDMTSAVASVVSSTANIVKSPPVETTPVPGIDNSLSGVVSPQDIAALQKKVQTLQASGNLFATLLVDTESPEPVIAPSENEVKSQLDPAGVVTEGHLALSGELEDVNSMKARVNSTSVIIDDLERTKTSANYSTSDLNSGEKISSNSGPATEKADKLPSSITAIPSAKTTEIPPTTPPPSASVANTKQSPPMQSTTLPKTVTTSPVKTKTHPTAKTENILKTKPTEVAATLTPTVTTTTTQIPTSTITTTHAPTSITTTALAPTSATTTTTTTTTTLAPNTTTTILPTTAQPLSSVTKITTKSPSTTAKTTTTASTTTTTTAPTTTTKSPSTTTKTTTTASTTTTTTAPRTTTTSSPTTTTTTTQPPTTSTTTQPTTTTKTTQTPTTTKTTQAPTTTTTTRPLTTTTTTQTPTSPTTTTEASTVSTTIVKPSTSTTTLSTPPNISTMPDLTPDEVSTWTGGLVTWTLPSVSSTPPAFHTWTVKVSHPVNNDLDDIPTVDAAVVIPASNSVFSKPLDSAAISPETKPPSTENIIKPTDTLKPSNLLQYLVSNPPEWVIEELLSELGGSAVGEGEAQPVSVISGLVRDSATTTTTTTTTTAATTTTTTSTAAPVTPKWDYKKDCGVQPLIPQGRIVGGKAASYGRFPWQVLIRESSWFGIFTKNKCGGVLIADKWVVSAAHCQPGFLSQLVVMLGEHDISNQGEQISAETRNVKRVIRHKDYVERTFENDLALLELETPITRKPNIVPICLPQTGSGLFEGEVAIVSGWGKQSVSGPTPSILHEVDVPIMTNRECHDMFKKAGHSKKVLDSFLCAGYPDGQKDSCEGDSGGPLQKRGPDGRWILAGTVSHGIKCAYPNLPGVYMRMTHYKPWINKVTGLSL